MNKYLDKINKILDNDKPIHNENFAELIMHLGDGNDALKAKVRERWRERRLLLKLVRICDLSIMRLYRSAAIHLKKKNEELK